MIRPGSDIARIPMTPISHVAARRHGASQGDSAMMRRSKDVRDDPHAEVGRAPGKKGLYYHFTVSEAPVPEIRVDPDHFDVVNQRRRAGRAARFHLRVMSVRRRARIGGARAPARGPAGPRSGSRAHRHHALHRPAAARSLLRRAAQERAACAALAGESGGPGAGHAGRARALRRRAELPVGVSGRHQREAGFRAIPTWITCSCSDSVPPWATYAASPLPLNALGS